MFWLITISKYLSLIKCRIEKYVINVDKEGVLTLSEIWGNEHPTKKEFWETRGNSLITCAVTQGKTPQESILKLRDDQKKPQDSLIRCPTFYRTTKRRSWKGELIPGVRSEPNTFGQLTIRINMNGQTRNTCTTRALFRDNALKGALIVDTTFCVRRFDAALLQTW